MQRILRKRVLRSLKANLFYYLAPGLLIVLGMYMVVSFVGAADTIITGVAEKNRLQNVEDGEFTVFVPLSEAAENSLRDTGITLEKQFYLDYPGVNGSVVRIFKNREAVNLVALAEGRMAVAPGEIVLEKHYAKKQALQTGSQLTLAGQLFMVTGIGTLPDYDAAYQELSDSVVASEHFGFGLVSPSDYENMKSAGQSIKAENFCYAYRLNDAIDAAALKEKLKAESVDPKTVQDPYFQDYWSRTGGKNDELLDGIVKLLDGSEALQSGLSELSASKNELTNLTLFLEAVDNPRIAASADDQVITLIAGLIAGVIVMVLFTYIIAVFVIHSIDRERPVIGAFYALGVRKKDLLCHYLGLPVLIAFFGGLLGTVLGYSPWGARLQMAEALSYFSLPDLTMVYSPVLLLYGIVMPVVVAVLVNALVINKKLSQDVLELLSNRAAGEKATQIELKHFSFIRRFQLRQMVREIRTSLTVVFGLFVALLIMMLGLNCYAVCAHVSIENKADTRFEYMYSYKYPTEQVPAGGVAAFGKMMKKEVFGYWLDVTLLGIDEANPYFDMKLPKGQDQVVITSAVARKFDLDIGDSLVLNNDEEGKLAAFTVVGVTNYSAGLYVFMNLADMRSYFDEVDNYYNIVFSDWPLAIETSRLENVTSRADIVKSADVFIGQMKSLIISMVVVSLMMLAVVLYLMMQVMIDRSAQGIALMKIFGYRTSELGMLYLNGNFYVIVLGALIGVPLAKAVMDRLYPVLVSNVAVGFNLSFPWWLYAMIYGGILALYMIINHLILAKVKKMSHVEVLKNRE